MRTGYFQKRRTTGTTLIEIMVYAALLGMFFYCIYGVLIASMRYFRIARATVEIQQQAMNAIANLSRDISQTKAEKIIIDTNPTGIIFPSPVDSEGKYSFDSSGELLWQKWICYYIDTNDGENYLFKKEYKIAPTTDPVAPVSMDTTAEFKNASLHRRTIAKNITGLNFSGITPLNIEVIFAKDPDYSNRNVVNIQTRVFIRN